MKPGSPSRLSAVSPVMAISAWRCDRGSTIPSARWPSDMCMSVNRPRSGLGGSACLFELVALLGGQRRLDAEQRGDAGDELGRGGNGVPAGGGKAHGLRDDLRIIE